MAESELRYNTDIPTEYYLKYRQNAESRPGDFYHGKDTDMLYKTWMAMKRGAVVGAISGATMSTYHPVTGFAIRPALEKAYRHGLPPLLAATTFGATLSLVANMRNKEDTLNHAIGGYAAGTVIGAWYKSQKVGVWSGIFFALAASGLKTCSDYGLFERPMTVRRERVFDFYRMGWMIERPPQEGVDDADKNDAVKHYSP